MKRGVTKFKTSISILAVAGLVISGCSSKDTSSNKEDISDITIMANLHTPEVPTDKIEKLLEKNTGFDLTFQWTPDSNYEEKLNTAFATETLAEATFLKNQASLVKFRQAIRDGQFWEIGPYLKDYENLSKLYEQTLQNTAVDGKVYSLYQGRPAARSGLIYRKDWAEKLGLSTPETIEDVYEMARAFTEDDPDGNGKDDTMGLSDFNDLYWGAFKIISSWHGTPNNWGMKDGELLPEFMFDEYIESMNYMKNLRDNNYMNNDFPVTSKEDHRALVKNGTAGMVIGPMGDITSIHRDTVELNPDATFDVQNVITGPDGDYGIWALPGYGNVVLFPKSAVETEEELKEILSFFDYLMSPEGANLLFWGIEGEHYEIQDGKALGIESDLSTRDVKPFQSIEIGEPTTNGKYESIYNLDVKAKAEELTVDNDKYLIMDPTAALDSVTYAEKGEMLAQKIADATYQYILGDLDLDGFKAAIEDWRSSGGDDIIKEYNEAYQKIKK
ncbi:extracellular solute-binding protein [Ferdinandcohnia sp. Marseille-Q9671]